MIEIRQTQLFSDWFDRLADARARARIDISELRIDYGPGYRVYYLQQGSNLVILLAGGDKSSQSSDIAKAIELARKLKA